MLFPILVILLSIVFYIHNHYPVGLIAIVGITSLIVYANIYLDQDVQSLVEIMLSPALITIMCMMIMGHALTANGALGYLANPIIKSGTKYPHIITLILACLLSSFMNNTTIVIIMIPIMHSLAKKMQISESKLMMPLAFASSLGGMLTVMGSSTNLLIQSKLESLGYSLNLFDFFLPGLVIATVGMTYTIFYLPKALKDRSAGKEESQRFITEILITSKDKICGKSTKDFHEQYLNTDILRVTRNRQNIHLNAEDILIDGDIVQISTDNHSIYNIINGHTLNVNSHSMKSQNIQKNDSMVIAEGIVKHTSNMIDLHITEACINGAVVVATEHYYHKSTRIRNGASVIMLVKKDCIDDEQLKNEVVLLDPTITNIPKITIALRPVVIFIGVLSAIACGLPVLIATLSGASACLMSRCTNFRDIKHCIDNSVILMIVYANVLSYVMTENGTLEMISCTILSLSQNLPPIAVLAIIFAVISILNEVISNNTVGLLFAPIMVDIGVLLDVDPRMFIWGLIFASGCAFATPVGYQTNLMVMSPGKYKFLDYVKAGIPLTLLIMISYCTFCIMYFK